MNDQAQLQRDTLEKLAYSGYVARTEKEHATAPLSYIYYRFEHEASHEAPSPLVYRLGKILYTNQELFRALVVPWEEEHRENYM